MKTLIVALVLLSSSLAVLPVAEGGPGEPNCYDIYNEWTVGPVTVIQRSSCNYQVCWNGDCELLK